MLTDDKCQSCRHYFNSKRLVEPVCRRGVTYGRHPVSVVPCGTMRDDRWWGNQACGSEAKLWEAKA